MEERRKPTCRICTSCEAGIAVPSFVYKGLRLSRPEKLGNFQCSLRVVMPYGIMCGDENIAEITFFYRQRSIGACGGMRVVSRFH